MSLVQQSNNRARASLGVAASFGLPAGSALLLDSLLPSGVTSARSLYRLTAAMRTACARVRRVSDNVLGDLMFDATGRVSLASPVLPVAGGAATTLAVFHGGGSVAIVEHYDQSGRGGRSEVIAAAAQPLLINNGALIANDGSGPLVAYDGVNDYSEWRFLRGHPHTLIVAGSMADLANTGAAFQADGQSVGAPAASGAALIPGNPGRSMFSGLSIGDNISDRGRYRCQLACFDSTQSRFYSNGSLVATGDTGATRVFNLLIGKNAAGAFSNASYHTLITLNRALTAAEAIAVSAAVLAFPT